MNKRLIVLSIVMFGATVFLTPAQAQRGVIVSRGGGRAPTGLVRLPHAGRFFAGSAFAPYFYPDYEPGLIEVPPPQIVVQTAAQASPAPVNNPPDSLVLELQGDHWVRITNNGQSQTSGQSNQREAEQASNQPPPISPNTPRQTQTAEPPVELPGAVLVFRDGHKEEISRYMIMGATIYTSADYWSSGSWTRKVQIADLDVPTTLKLNQERGAKFNLPSGPNEVIVRP